MLREISIAQRAPERSLQVAILSACRALAEGKWVGDFKETLVRNITLGLGEALEAKNSYHLWFRLRVGQRHFEIYAGDIHATSHWTFDVWLTDASGTRLDPHGLELDACLSAEDLVPVLTTGKGRFD